MVNIKLGNMLFLSALVLINSFFECVYIISEIAPWHLHIYPVSKFRMLYIPRENDEGYYQSAE